MSAIVWMWLDAAPTAPMAPDEMSVTVPAVSIELPLLRMSCPVSVVSMVTLRDRPPSTVPRTTLLSLLKEKSRPLLSTTLDRVYWLPVLLSVSAKVNPSDRMS